MIFYIGLISISIAFIFTVASMSAFFLYHSNKSPQLFEVGKKSFYVAFLGIVSSMGLLLYLILTHQFQYNYVYSYTNRSLSLFYLISALWAGQEGTFLLWLLFGSIYGFVLLKQRPKNMHIILGIMLLVHTFILLILLEKNPFAMVWHVFKDAPVGFIPADGRGLNPLLMNPWMVIHPPTLFLGYVSSEVIFGFIMAAFISREFKNWYKPAWPWILYGTAILGIGIILGGYWSYATLGWGGFWGWDPVENASFVPWMIYATLIHGVLLQKSRGALVKTNFFLAGLVFILVLYGSFLTRSGVLTDFSVHSFGESDLNIYLIVFLLFFVSLFLFFFIKYFTKIKGEPLKSDLFTKETFIVFGMLVLILSGILTFIGLSFPLISSLFGKPTNVPLSYYNTLHIPIAILIALLGGLSPLLAWNKPTIQKKKIFFGSVIASIVITGVSITLGLKDIRSIIMFLSAIFFLSVNLSMLVEMARLNLKAAGAYLTHVGIAFMLLGIIIFSFYSKSEKVNLPKGKVVNTSFGVKLKFEGKIPQPDGRDRMKISVIEGNNIWYAKPQFFFSQYNQAYMASPAIDYQLFGDLYISPIQFIPASRSNSKQLIFNEGAEKRYGDYVFKFTGFDVNNHSEERELKVWANFDVTYTKDGYTRKETIRPLLKMGNSGMQKEKVGLEGLQVEIGNINASNKQVALLIHDIRNAGVAKDILSIEISKKPFISFMWLGTVLLGIGMLIAFINRLNRKDLF